MRPDRRFPAGIKSLFAAWLLLVSLVVTWPGDLLGQVGGRPKISPKILANRVEKQTRPAGVGANDHRKRVFSKGLNSQNLDGEDCALYSSRPLTAPERAVLAAKGIVIQSDLWVPPVPGKHPDGFHLATVAYASLGEVEADPRIVFLESVEYQLEPNNDLGLEMIKAIQIQNGVGVTARNGAGVKVAIADSGFDLTHPDLPTPVEKFDVTDGVGIANWGTNVANTVSAHGTHVAGTAVGSGGLSAGKYKGSGPGASLYLYKIGNDTNARATYADMIEAIDRAKNVGVRIFSMSYGGLSTYMDGSASVEQAIDAAVAAGMTVFISAGNDGDKAAHDSVSVPPSTTSSSFGFVLSNPSSSTAYTENVDLYVIWRDGVPNDGNITLACTNLGSGETLTQNFSNSSNRGTDSKIYALKPNLAASVSKTYNFTFQNTASSGATPVVHIYRASGLGTFTSPDSGYTVGTPALADGAIAVGAWTQRRFWTTYLNSSYSFSGSTAIGTLATFSSRGPRIDGVMKPDFVAPGTATISARESVAGLASNNAYIIDNDGLNLNGSGPANYYVMQGTSMACPLAAGAAALLLEGAPSLTPSQLKAALTSTASQSSSPTPQAGHGLIDVLAALDTQSGPAPQTITFAPIANQITTNTFTLSATGGGSGNPVTFAVTSGPAVIGPSNVVSFVGAGSVVITASQAGNANYLPASDVSRIFNVTRATVTITLTPLSQTYTGATRTVSAATNPPSLPVTITYNGIATPPVNAGTYALVGTVDTSMYHGSASSTLTVAKAAATISLSNLTQVYNGTPRPVGVVTVPAGLAYSVTYNEFPSAPYNPGSYPVAVTINETNYAGSNSGTLVVSQASQTIWFLPLADTITTATVNLSATGGGSANPVTFAVTEGPGLISGGNQLTFTGAGLVRVVASQAGNSNYLAATLVEQPVNVTKAPAQILLSGLNPVYNGSPRGAGITTVPSGLSYTVTYAGSATEPTAAGTYPLVVTVNDPIYGGNATDDFVIQKAAGQVTLSGLSRTYTGTPQGATVTTDPAGAPVLFTYDGLPALPVAAGNYTVVATIDHPSIEGSASGTLVIAKAPQTITFPEILPQFATDTVLLSAGGGGSNNPIFFAVTEGPATISGDTSLTFSGSGDVSIEATQAGDANYLAATPVTRSFSVSKFPASVILSNMAQAYDGSPRVPTVTTSPAGLTPILTYAGEPDPPVLPGTYFVIAYLDDAFYEGDIAGDFVITKGIQTIDFPALPAAPADGTLTLSATGGGSVNPVTFEVAEGPGVISGGDQLSFTAPGVVIVRASQAGDDLYHAAAPVERTVSVNKAAATVTFIDLTATYDGGAHAAAATTVPAGLAVTYTYNTLATEPVGAGSYAVVATIADSYYQGTATETFVVNKAGQTIIFPAIPPRVATDTVHLGATGGASGSPVTFAVGFGPGVISSGNVLNFTGAGEVGITASQEGGANHLPAPVASQTVTVAKAAASLTLAPLRQVHDGSPREVLVTTEPPGLGYAVSYHGDPAAPTAIGSYEVTAILDDPIYEGSVTGTLLVDDPGAIILVPGGELPPISAFGPLAQPTFALSRYEVTGGLWREVSDWAAANGYDIGAVGIGCADDHPVRRVNWYDAVKWCNARTEWENAMTGSSLAPAYLVSGDVYRSGEPALLTDIVCDFGTSGYRLPTGSEWEFAARGGEGAAPQTYPGGENSALLAWYAANSAGAACDILDGRGTFPVGHKSVSTAGFFDLAGNIAEWSWDANPGDPAARLVVGGSWDSAAAAVAIGALAGESPAMRDDRIGFRVGRSVALAIGEAVDFSASEWDSGTDSAWHAQTGVTYDGDDAAASGPLRAGGEIHVRTTISGPGNVSFRWKINLPAEAGKLLLSVGGTVVTGITGDSGWVEGTAYVPTGDQAVRWTFVRTDPAGPAPDPVNTGAWLDEVVYTAAIAPAISTVPVSEIGDTSAESGGEITSDGGSPVTARGVIIGLSPDPVPGAGVINFPATLGDTPDFQVLLTSLDGGITYYARAYATSEAGTGYGESLAFTTDTNLLLPGGVDVVDRSILPGDRQVFHFSLTGPRRVHFSTFSGASLVAELYDSEGTLVATFDGDGIVLFEAILYPGEYSLHLSRLPDPAGIAETFELAVDATTVVETRPDVAVGSALTAVAGVGIYNTAAGQLAGYTSVKARAVSALATFRNAGTLPDEMLISGTPGNAIFGVVYTNASANITAQVITGTYRTPALAAGDEVSWIRAIVSPNKKKLTKKKKGGKPKMLRRSQLLQIRAASVFDPALGDTGYINVQTK